MSAHLADRVEAWQQTDETGCTRTAIVEVRADGTVLVTYELLAKMLGQLGFSFASAVISS